MAGKIVQVDLAQPLPTLRADDRLSAFYVLVKLAHQPLAWIRLPARQFGDYITPDMLAGLISQRVGADALEIARERRSHSSTAANKPSISVAVCTRGENPDALERLLQTLARQQYPAQNFEVIVIDNASTSDAVANLCRRMAFVRHVFEPRAGIAYARNTAWQVARNEIVAYLDDNASVDPHWLSMIAENYADPRVSCVGGSNLPSAIQTRAQEHFEQLAAPRRCWRRRVYESCSATALAALVAHQIDDGTFSVRRKSLQQLGGFDPALPSALDVMTRILKDGGRVVTDPRVICWRATPRGRQELRRAVYGSTIHLAAWCAKYFADAQLANNAAAIFRGAIQQNWKRLITNAKAAATLRPHLPLSISLIALIGTLRGLCAYRRAIRRVRTDSIRFRQQGIIRLAPIKAAA